MLRTGLVIAAVVLALDQATKLMVLWWLDPLRPIEVTSFLNLRVVWNPGVSFGMLGGAGPLVLTVVAILVVAALVVWMARTDRRLVGVALGLVVGGAIGNVVDRVRFGAVLDFLDFHAFGYHWPAFNVADGAITVGAALIVADSLLGSR
jgi:signal peptidase II